MTNPEFDQGGEQIVIGLQEVFHDKLFRGQVYIDQLYDNGRYTDELGIAVAKHLDEFCPYIDRPVLISGRAFVPIIDTDEMIIIDEDWVESVTHEGSHEGVDIIMLENGRPMLVQRIKSGSIFVRQGQTIFGSLELHSYFTNEATITFLLEIEETYNPFYLGTHDQGGPIEGFNVVSEKSDELVDLLQDPQFRQMSHEHQKLVVEDFIEEVAQTASISELPVIMQTQYGYVTSLTASSTIELLPIDLSSVVISGQCLAVDSLEHLQLRFRPIVSDEEILDKSAGLCLVLDPDLDSRTGLELDASQVIYIPMSGQSFEMQLLLDAYEY